MCSGAIILDSNCFKHLEETAIQDKISAILEELDFEIWPSALNVFELSKTRNDAVRKRLLRIVPALCRGRFLLPHPQSILHRVACAALNGESRFQTSASGLEWLLEDDSFLTPELINQTQDLSKKMNTSFERLHSRAREVLSKRFNPGEIRKRWPSAKVFLDSQWMRPAQLDTFIQNIWKSLDLPGVAPIPLILSLEAWRLYLEGLGAAIYQRAISLRLSKKVQMSDISQLVYLAGRQRSLLVTEDIGFIEVAREVIEGRYRDKQILCWEDFLRGTL